MQKTFDFILEPHHLVIASPVSLVCGFAPPAFAPWFLWVLALNSGLPAP
jgi:hypothetical protein